MVYYKSKVPPKENSHMKNTEFFNQLRAQSEKDHQDLSELTKSLKKENLDHLEKVKQIKADIKFLTRRISQTSKFLETQGQKPVVSPTTTSTPTSLS